MTLKLKAAVLLCILFCCSTFIAEAQRRNKRTSKREIRKRQEEANEKSQYNKFNKLQPMGLKSTQARNDFIWSYETANTVPLYAGDISLVVPSRFSLKRGVEFGGSIGTLGIVPNFYLKKKWKEGKLYIASRHQVYSYSPMLYWAKEMKFSNLFPLQSKVPITVALKNELIFSKPFLDDLKCGSVKEAYIIITGAIAYDYGIAIEETDVNLMQPKLLKQRSDVILGNGGFFSARLQGDFYIFKDLYGTVALRWLMGNSNLGNSLEQNSLLKFKLTPRFSISGGYWMTFGKGTETPIMPIIDLTYHFGNKQGRQKGLFGK